MEGGHEGDALVDLTGGVSKILGQTRRRRRRRSSSAPQRIPFASAMPVVLISNVCVAALHESRQASSERDKVWRLLLSYQQRGYLMGTASNGEEPAVAAAAPQVRQHRTGPSSRAGSCCIHGATDCSSQLRPFRWVWCSTMRTGC